MGASLIALSPFLLDQKPGVPSVPPEPRQTLPNLHDRLLAPMVTWLDLGVVLSQPDCVGKASVTV